ncbi:MAG: hypothetical protein ACLPX9_10530 [Rhodomicrobium sp.]
MAQFDLAVLAGGITTADLLMDFPLHSSMAAFSLHALCGQG